MPKDIIKPQTAIQKTKLIFSLPKNIFGLSAFLAILLTLPIALVLLGQRQNILQYASVEVTVCPQVSPRMLGEKSISSRQTLSELQSPAERKSQLIEIMRSNPEKALSLVLKGKARDTIASNTKNCVEEKVTVQGKLEITHADLRDKTSQTEYSLIDQQGNRLILHPGYGIKKGVTSGSSVSVQGYKLDQEIVFNGTTSFSQTNEETGINILSSASTSVLGVQKTIALVSNVVPADTSSRVNDIVFTQNNNFYRENSYSKIYFAGNTLLNLPIVKSCQIGELLNSAIASVDQQIDFRNYKRIVIIVPAQDCAWIGIGSIGYRDVVTGEGTLQMSVAWVSSNLIGSVYNGFDLGTIAIFHELGHNLGNHHARFINCYIPDSPECVPQQYGDIYDIMGNEWYRMGHLSAPHKENVGWLDSSSLRLVTTSGQYTLLPIEGATAGLKALKIPRKNSDEFLYVEFRQSTGFDNSLSTISGINVFNGALLHITQYSLIAPYLISYPDVNSILTAALLPGATFTDPTTGTQISVSLGRGSLNVKVTFASGATPTPTLQPTTTTSISPTPCTTRGCIRPTLAPTPTPTKSCIGKLCYISPTPIR